MGLHTYSITPKLRNLPVGSYQVYFNGEYFESRTIDTKSSSLVLDIEVAGTETDVVVLKT